MCTCESGRSPEAVPTQLKNVLFLCKATAGRYIRDPTNTASKSASSKLKEVLLQSVVQKLDRGVGLRVAVWSSGSGRPRASTWVCILVYMPIIEQPQELFSSYLELAEHLISQFNSDDPMIVLGDFNVYLGSRDPNAHNAYNISRRGLQWNAVAHTYSLHYVLLILWPDIHILICNTSTIDYILANLDVSSGISCVTLEDHPLNTSNHLPVTCLSHFRSPTTPAFPSQTLNWVEGEVSLCTTRYANCSDNIAHPFLGKYYTSIEEVEADIGYVCQKRIEAADVLIPKKQTKSTKKVRDNTLSHLSWKSHRASGRRQADHCLVSSLMKGKSAREILSQQMQNQKRAETDSAER